MVVMFDEYQPTRSCPTEEFKQFVPDYISFPYKNKFWDYKKIILTSKNTDTDTDIDATGFARS